MEKPFVVASEFLQSFNTPFSYQVHEIGKIELKGSEEKEKLFSLSFF